MKIFVLYDKSGIHSGRVLGSYLIKHLANKATVHKGRPVRLAQLLKAKVSYDYIINVGWYQEFDSGGATVLNVTQAISLSSNKRKARIKFKENNIQAPKLWLHPGEITPKDLPIIARTTHHTKGRGLWFCKSMAELNKSTAAGATHYLKFIPNTREFRVHAIAPEINLDGVVASDYRVIKLSEKIPRPEGENSDIVKNHDSGWIFSYPKDRHDPILTKVREISKDVLATFKLHWGAVDIMVSKDTGEIFVLEINSTPCLTDDQANTLEKYAYGMCVLLGLADKPIRKNKIVVAVPLKPAIIPKIKKERKKLYSFLARKNF